MGVKSPPCVNLIADRYVKFINLYPEELANEILSILRQHANVIDNELQQRACEYLALAQYKANPDLIVSHCM